MGLFDRSTRASTMATIQVYQLLFANPVDSTQFYFEVSTAQGLLRVRRPQAKPVKYVLFSVFGITTTSDGPTQRKFMELLVLLIAEFFYVTVIPVILLVFEIIGGFVSLVAYFISEFAFKKSPNASTETATASSTSPILSKAIAVSCWLFGGLFAVGLVAALVVNSFLFAPSVAWVARGVSERSGIEIAFDRVDGNLFTGRFLFDGLRVGRRIPDKTEYALTIDTADVKVDLFSLVGQPKLSHLKLSGIGGDIWSKRRKPSPDMGNGGEAGDGSAAGQLRPRKNFEIRALNIANAQIALHHGTAPPLAVTIDTLDSPLLRSRYAIFDAAFRANLNGTINGHAITIATKSADDGFANTWRLEDIPAGLLGDYVDRPPFKWFERGTVDVLVENELGSGNNAKIDMDWRIVLEDMKMANPGDGPLLARAAYASMARYINARDKDIDLHFQLAMNEDQFETRSSLDAAGLWTAVMKGTATAVVAKSGAAVGRAKDKVKGTLDKAKSFFKRDRKNAAEDTPKP